MFRKLPIVVAALCATLVVGQASAQQPAGKDSAAAQQPAPKKGTKGMKKHSSADSAKAADSAKVADSVKAAMKKPAAAKDTSMKH